MTAAMLFDDAHLGMSSVDLPPARRAYAIQWTDYPRAGFLRAFDQRVDRTGPHLHIVINKQNIPGVHLRQREVASDVTRQIVILSNHGHAGSRRGDIA